MSEAEERYWEEEANSLEIQCTELEEKIKELGQEKAELEKLSISRWKIISELQQQKSELIEFAKDNLKVICINCKNNIIKNCICQMKEYNIRIVKKFSED